MADFDLTKSGYNEIQSTNNIEDSTLQEQAFLGINISGMTVNDIKIYIDLLMEKAGWLTPEEITQIVSDIAKHSGFLSQPEIQNIVLHSLQDAGAITTTAANLLVKTEVAEQILKLNNNTDFILSIKDNLLQEINTLRIEVQTTDTNSKQNLDKIERTSLSLGSKIQKLIDSMEVHEELLQDQSGIIRLDDKIDRESTQRTQEINNVFDRIRSNNSTQNLKITNLNNLLLSTDNKINTLGTNLSREIQTAEHQVKERVLHLSEKITHQEQILNGLMLDSSGLIQKITSINNIKVSASGEVLLETQKMQNELLTKIGVLKSEINLFWNSIQAQKTTSSLTENYLKTGIANVETKLDIELANLQGKINMEIKERKIKDATTDQLNREQLELGAKNILALEDKYTDIILTIDKFPDRLIALIGREELRREEGDTSLNIRINKELIKIRNEMSLLNPTLLLQDEKNKREKLENTLLSVSKKLNEYQVQNNSIMSDLEQQLITYNLKRVQENNDIKTQTDIKIGKINTDLTIINSNALISSSNIENNRNLLLAKFEDLVLNLAQDGNLTGTYLNTIAQELNQRYSNLFIKVDTNKVLLNQYKAQQDLNFEEVRTLISGTDRNLKELIIREEQSRLSSDGSLLNKIIQQENNYLTTIQGSQLSDCTFKKVYNKIGETRGEFQEGIKTYNELLSANWTNTVEKIDWFYNKLQNLETSLSTETSGRLNQESLLFIEIEKLKHSLISGAETLKNNLNNKIDTLILSTQGTDSRLEQEIQDRILGDITRNQELTTTKDSILVIKNNLTDLIAQNNQSAIDNLNQVRTSLIQEINRKDALVDSNTVLIIQETENRILEDTNLKKIIDSNTLLIQELLNTGDNSENLNKMQELMTMIGETDALDSIVGLENKLVELLSQEIKDRKIQEANIRQNNSSNFAALDTKINTVSDKVDQEVADLSSEVQTTSAALGTKIDTNTGNLIILEQELSDIRDQDLIKIAQDLDKADSNIKAYITSVIRQPLEINPNRTTLLDRLSQIESTITNNYGSLDSFIKSSEVTQNNKHIEVGTKTQELDERIKALSVPSSKNYNIDFVNSNLIYKNIFNINKRLQEIDFGLGLDLNQGVLKTIQDLDDITSEIDANLTSVGTSLQAKIDRIYGDASVGVTLGNLSTGLTITNNNHTLLGNIVHANEQKMQETTMASNSNTEAIIRISNQLDNDTTRASNMINEVYVLGGSSTQAQAFVDDINNYRDLISLNAAIAINQTEIFDLDANLTIIGTNLTELSSSVNEEIQRLDSKSDNTNTRLGALIDTERAQRIHELEVINEALTRTSDAVIAVLSESKSTLDSFVEIEQALNNQKIIVLEEILQVKSLLQGNINTLSNIIQKEIIDRVQESLEQDIVTTAQREYIDEQDSIINNLVLDLISTEAEHNITLGAKINQEIEDRKIAISSIELPEVSFDELSDTRIDNSTKGDILFVDEVLEGSTLIKVITSGGLKDFMTLDKYLESLDTLAIEYVVINDIETDAIKKISYGVGGIEIGTAEYLYLSDGNIASCTYLSSTKELIKRWTYLNGKLRSILTD